MWDTAIEQPAHAGIRLSRDLPCSGCGHATHSFLPCGEACDCSRIVLPGQPSLA